MDTALPQKCPFILDRNLAKANCTGNRVCTSCDIEVLRFEIKINLEVNLFPTIKKLYKMFVFIKKVKQCLLISKFKTVESSIRDLHLKPSP